MSRILMILFVGVFAMSPQVAKAKECVVLLHGLARTSNSFLLMQWRLNNAEYTVVNYDYPSKDSTVQELAENAVPNAVAQCGDADVVHFVTHSLGGILVRLYLGGLEELPENLGHVVMLAPPNNGSEVVDELIALPGFELWNGIAGAQLGTGEDSVVWTLPAVNYSLGVIAGNQSISPVFSRLIEGEDDGKVSVSSTKVDGMADHIVLPVTHTFMMNDRAVYTQVTHFLEHGTFLKE